MCKQKVLDQGKLKNRGKEYEKENSDRDKLKIEILPLKKYSMHLLSKLFCCWHINL